MQFYAIVPTRGEKFIGGIKMLKVFFQFSYCMYYIRVIIPLLLVQSFLFSEQYYVNGDIGDDTNDCESPSTPCKTITKGIERAGEDGDEVIISALSARGKYFENLRIRKSITIKSADPLNPAIIDGSQSSSSYNKSCIIVDSPSNVQLIHPTIKDLEITGGKGTDVIGDHGLDGLPNTNDFGEGNGLLDANEKVKKVGGGILVIGANLTSKGNIIKGNGDDVGLDNSGECKGGGGGGVFAGDDGLAIGDNNADDPPNPHYNAPRGSSILIENNVFSDNKSVTNFSSSIFPASD